MLGHDCFFEEFFVFLLFFVECFYFLLEFNGKLPDRLFFFRVIVIIAGPMVIPVHGKRMNKLLKLFFLVLIIFVHKDLVNKIYKK